MTIAVALDGRLGGFTLQVMFEVPSTGVTVLLGPSGSGKTTILRALAGLDRIAGTIIVDGMVWQDGATFVPSEQRRTGYVFQGPGLLPHLSVAANLAYAERRAPSGPFSRAAIIERTGIAPLLDRQPARLSGGEAQRASIARALLAQPRLLLMDEPLSALDSEARTALLGWLEQLLADIGIPVFYVTHDHAEAARLAARTLRISNGRLTS
ncbi:ATP-binding cassette domain-containing protein [Rhizorhabdus dicambivorans]|uniref:ABC transporter n=1 Tax=Rhizorhabdus dicambivorans TaxID=1850238 RepID=A0A2A4FTJ3_9SPHN|nr:ATP-binding cassette domain-containing protein [Rhizorhabdus dicambivorans]ATE66154.1 ABC transporter [Rhizorhabdus dicambivorans]PCE42080.1 ABC transporter [Rhizorhabdus dicambivorans]